MRWVPEVRLGKETKNRGAKTRDLLWSKSRHTATAGGVSGTFTTDELGNSQVGKEKDDTVMHDLNASRDYGKEPLVSSERHVRHAKRWR